MITAVDTYDVRFPTSRELDGSDAMNPDPDYSAAYVVLRTDGDDEGHGFAFTIGRGNDIVTVAIQTLADAVIGLDETVIFADMGEFARRLTHDSQLRWLGPEKGVMHMAIAAVVNAAWDLWGRREGRPVWELLSGLDPEQIVDLVDWRYLTDALTPAEALELLQAAVPGRAARAADVRANGYPAYTTSAGWLGYDDAKLERLVREAMEDGFGQIKLKVGASMADDRRRFRIARQVTGPEYPIAVDANQRWDVGDAIAWMRELAEFQPYWIEEPTSPDDVLGHATIRRALHPIRIATGEHVQNRIMFKQLLQADAIDVLQLDACRVGGVNENVAIMLLAAKYGVPVCPHAGGVGLCELVQHLAMFDYIAVSGRQNVIEWVDHLHEHFVHPASVHRGRYVAPTAPGFSAAMKPSSIAAYRYPDGVVWKEDRSA